MRIEERGIDSRFDELSLLYRLASAGATAEHEGLVVDEILRATRELIPCRHVSLFLLEEGSEQMRVCMAGHRDGHLALSEPSIVRRIFQNQRAEVVNDILADPDSSPVLADDVGAAQVVAAPLTVADKRLGVIAAINSLQGAFSDDDLGVMGLLGDQAALALDNSRLRSTLHRQVQEIEGLHRLTRLLASSETPDHVIGESVRIVADLIECEKVALLLYEEESDALVAHARVVGMTPEQAERLQISLSEPSLAGSVYRTDAPLISNDARNDNWVSREMQDLLDIDTLLVVPLATGGRAMGVLNAVNARKGHFDSGDLRFATILGSRIGSVIESSRARERERALLLRLREADHTKSEFVSMLAHELKGPMTTISGFGKALHDDWDRLDEDRRERILEIITKEIGRLARLVNDLLDLSRMEAGTLRYELANVSVSELVESVISVHTSLSQRHHVRTAIPADLPKVHGDSDRIRQVVINLLTNAVRHSPDDSVVEVAANLLVGGEWVQVSVRDQGIGIAPEDRERVFSKFVNVPKPDWIQKGTGLGLFISRGIVEAHGGGIWVESTPGEGATFNFTLPVARDREA